MNRMRALNLLLILSVFAALAPLAVSQQEDASAQSQSHHEAAQKDPHHTCPMAMEERGDKGMGFSQSKTTHHFLLKRDGGVIGVEANDAKDTENRDQIRMHLSHIAKAFAAGDFDIPMFVHDQTPPGVPVMKAKRDQIKYRFEETENGGRVVIVTGDPEALAALHDFLAFQIREHKTGDSLSVQ
jgi:hypothetical protein